MTHTLLMRFTNKLKVPELLCYHCRKPILEDQKVVSLMTRYGMVSWKVYHVECFETLFI